MIYCSLYRGTKGDHFFFLRLRGSASPLLKATQSLLCETETLGLFRLTPGGQTPTYLHAKWLKRRGFTHGCAFCSTNRYFLYPLISRSPKKSKFGNFLDFSLNFAFNIRGHWENIPYSSSESNESDIVNRQNGGEKIKYVVKFYMGDTCHVISRTRNDYLPLCLWWRHVNQKGQGHGVKQGGVLSPMLFCLDIDGLLERLSHSKIGRE